MRSGQKLLILCSGCTDIVTSILAVVTAQITCVHVCAVKTPMLLHNEASTVSVILSQ